MNLSEYRASPKEQARTSDLVRLFQASGKVALDIGARDGHFSRLLADRFDLVFALDLSEPAIVHPRVRCVKGNALALEFDDASIDFVLCAEVMEHIPTELLSTVCRELARVSRGMILIGVPYKQDTRVGRTTCYSCGKKNPPWGHVNIFDELRIAAMFPMFRVQDISYVGSTTERTNWLSMYLMDLAGNPYGTYNQEEPCINCGAQLLNPPTRTIGKKLLTRLGFWAKNASNAFASARPNWIHVLLAKDSGT